MESSYAKAYQARKLIERDHQTLANRIKLLQQEELKSWKKIEETRKRAQEVYSIKNKLQDKYQRQVNEMIQQHRSLSEKREHINKVRNERKRGQLYIKSSLFQSKREEGIIMREIKQYYSERRAESINSIINENQQKKEKVRLDEVAGTERVHNFRQLKLEELKTDSLRRCQEANAVREAKNDQLKELENQELELIKQLQNTQILQKQVYEELGDTLRHNPVKQYVREHYKR